MRKLILFLCVAVFAVSLSGVRAEYDVVPVDAKISKVTVFPDAALMVRTANVNLEAGYSVVQIDRLPMFVFADNSIVSGKGTMRIISTEFTNRWEKVPPNEEVKTLVAELDTIEATTLDLANRLEVLKKEEAFYTSLTPSIPKEFDIDKVQDLSTDACKSLLDLVEKGLASVYEKRREINDKLEDLNAQKAALRIRIREMGGSDVRFNVALITVYCAGSTKGVLELTSLVGGCSWSTNYDAKLLDNKSVELQYFADVRQNTGENWDNVILTLSTSYVSSVVLPPELKRWAITIVQPDKPSKSVGRKAANAMPATRPAEDSKSDGYEYEGKDQEADARTLGGGMAVEFDIALATIPGNGTVQRLTVQKFTFTGDLVYEAVPRMSPFAFARIEIVNNSEFPLIPGNLRAFSGGELLGSTYIEPVSTGQKFKLYFGADPSVQVKYKPISRKVDAGKRTQEIEFEYILEFKNNRSTPVTINVTDALPLPKNDEIKIKSVKISPDPIENPEKTDEKFIKWNITLQPGETKNLKVEFRVTAPGDWTLDWNGAWQGGAQ